MTTRSSLPPTPRQIDAARAINTLTKRHGYAPSLTELAASLGVTFGRARDLVHEGRERGLVAFEDGLPRTLRVLEHPAIRRRDRGA